MRPTRLYGWLALAVLGLAAVLLLGEALVWVASPTEHLVATGPSAQERIYVELLDLFARKLAADGRRLPMISVDQQLARTPYIERSVFELEARGLLDYVEVLEWLEGLPPYRSPEGHTWGAPAHAVIGEALADVVVHVTVAGDSASGTTTR